MSDKNQAQFPERSSGVGGVDADEPHSDASFNFPGQLPHAPATSHGTYIDGIDEGLEPLEEYRQGGYHPVHLNDCLGAAGRYRVIHKLGYGGFGTVWLCRDTTEAKYVAIKVMIADVAPDQVPDLNIAKLDRSMMGAEYIAFPLDHFSVEGPNGTHQCIVLPVLGPCVSPRLWLSLEQNAGSTLRRMVHQAVKAMAFLHNNGFCHGDFRASNILVKLTNFDRLPESQVLSLLSEPRKASVRTESGDDLPASSPRYLVTSIDISRLGNAYLTDEICVIDFGESFPITSPPEDLGIPENYLPPELLLQEENAVGPACDLWALGCTLFEIRQQIPLFYMIHDDDELLAEMVRFFGEMPKEWWDKWEARPDFFDDQGTWLGENISGEDWSLEVALSKPHKIFKTIGDDGKKVDKKTSSTSEVEQKLMADLLYKMLRFEPGKRANLDEVLEHEWFKMK